MQNVEKKILLYLALASMQTVEKYEPAYDQRSQAKHYENTRISNI